MSEEKRGPVSRLLRRVGGGVKTSLAAVGVIAVAGMYREYKKLKSATSSEDTGDGKEKERKVLVVPFHRLHLVEHKSRSFGL